ncbi:hypothetical protein [Jidongwangia harbinensis]|uniref:hypothetical protein n=1 Tax=Jidongwangia harbinensis TaxID=2878561 RepID=UPI001CD9DDB7|nr:hypothetical protein [Jidongwangia harbinensis]MCA2218434.1 hypothetical protein [Jidongwangia harbinensis]
MIDINAWLAAGAGLVGAAVTAVNLGGLLRTHLRQRVRVQLERERSARCIARAAGMAELVNNPRARIRMVERDDDGERLIEIGEPARSGEAAA